MEACPVDCFYEGPGLLVIHANYSIAEKWKKNIRPTKRTKSTAIMRRTPGNTMARFRQNPIRYMHISRVTANTAMTITR